MLSIDLHYSVVGQYDQHFDDLHVRSLPVLDHSLLDCMQTNRVRSWQIISWAKIFFLYTYIIIKNPTNGRVNVTLIEVASVFFLVDWDGSSLLEYKDWNECIYEVLAFLAFYIPLPYHVFYILVYEFLADPLGRSFVDFSEYLLEKHQLLQKVKSILIKGTLLIIFSWVLNLKIRGWMKCNIIHH